MKPKVWSTLTTTTPSDELAETTVRISPSTSVSFTSTLTGVETPESSETVRKGEPTAPSSTATGASFTAVTDTNTVALALPPWPSEVV